MTRFLALVFLAFLAGCNQDVMTFKSSGVSDWEKVERSLGSLREMMVESGVVSVMALSDGLRSKKSFASDFEVCRNCEELYGEIKSELDTIQFESAFFDRQTGDFRVSVNSLFGVDPNHGDHIDIVIDAEERFSVGSEINYYESLPSRTKVLDRVGNLVLLRHLKS